VSVEVLLTTVSPAKTAEPIDMPFGGGLGGSQPRIGWSNCKAYTWALPDEYHRMSKHAAVWAAATITVATCFYWIWGGIKKRMGTIRTKL